MSLAGDRIPYPGPRPFEVAESNIFFGRDREIRDLHLLVIAHRALLLFAQSGAGKTSVLKAGLIPKLQGDGIEVLPIARVQGVDPARLGLGNVANIFAFNVLLSWAGDRSDPEALAQMGLAQFLAQRPHANDKHGEPVLRVAIFDQFEELFTAYPEHWAQRRALIEQIAAACEADLALRVVLVIREDHLAELMPHAELLPEALRATFHLERLSEPAAIGAVEKPLAGTGRSFAEGVARKLVKRLLQVQVGAHAEGQAHIEAQYVEPVQLQVVCRRLWQQLPRAVDVVTDEQLREFGDVDQALRSFYEESIAATVKKTGVDEEALRRWFDTQLITSAGTRGTVFQGESTSGGIPNTAVQVLEDDHHIVRAELRHGSRWYELTHDRFVAPIRESNAAWLKRAGTTQWRKRAVAYGLLFVLVTGALQFALGSWRSAESRKEARREAEVELAKQRIQLEVEKKAAVALEADRLRLEKNSEIAELERAQKSELALQKTKFELERDNAIRRAELEQSERLLTDGQIDRLRADKKAGRLSDELAEAGLDGVANYLWAKGDVARLTDLLKRNADLIPSRYGLDERALSLMPLVDEEADWPLTLEYSPQAQLDESRFVFQWRSLASNLTQMWGIPAPLRLKLKENANLSAREFRLVATPAERGASAPDAAQREPVVISTDPTEVLVTRPTSPPALVKFFAAQKKSPMTQFKHGGEWWLVPAWTQPVWKVAGHASFDRDGAIALAVATRALEKPEVLLNRDSVAYLLERLARTHPDTVGEALAARGLDRLTQDLRRIVAEPHRRDLKDLEYLLDSLANQPAAAPDDAAETAVDDASLLVRSAPRVLAVPAARKEVTLESLKAMALIRRHVYEEASASLPKPESAQVRIIIGEHVEQRLVKGNELSPELLEALAGLRGRFSQRFGFIAPAVRVRTDTALPPDAFRIEVANQRPGQKDLRTIEAKGDRVLPTLMQELDWTYAAYRSWWLTPEKVSGLIDGLPSKQQEWLRARYSLTDLKLVLRGVIDPSWAERQAYEKGERESALRFARPEQTLDGFNGAMASLVFWAAANPNDRSLAGITAHLWQVQRARLAGATPAAPSAGVAKTVADGIRSLQDDRIDLATQYFAEAVARDRRGATAAFYPLHAAQSRREDTLVELFEDCELPEPGRAAKATAPSVGTRYRIETFIQRAGASLAAPDRRRLNLCLLWTAVKEKHLQNADELHGRLTAQPKADWSPQEQYFLASLLLDAHGKEMAVPADRAEIEQLLRAALSGLKLVESERVFEELLNRHGSASRAPRWYVALMRSLSTLKADSFWNPLQMGGFLRNGRTVEDLQASMRSFDTAESRLNVVEADDRARLQTWLDLWRADALSNLLEFEPSAERRNRSHEEVTRSIERVIGRIAKDARGWPTLDDAYGSLVSAHYSAGRVDDIARSVDAWLAKEPDSGDGLRHKAIVLLTRFEADRAVDLVQRSMEKYAGRSLKDWNKAEMLYLAAIVETLTGKGNYDEDARTFINDTEHANRDFIRLMLFWRLKIEGRDKEAADVIDGRMSSISAGSWASRMKEGDSTVWGEHLVSLYAGRLRLDELLAVTRTREAFETSAFSGTGLTYESVSTDIHFYDALRQSVSGDPATRRARLREGLERASKIGRIDFFETHMARYLLNSRQ